MTVAEKWISLRMQGMGRAEIELRRGARGRDAAYARCSNAGARPVGWQRQRVASRAIVRGAGRIPFDEPSRISTQRCRQMRVGSPPACRFGTDIIVTHDQWRR